MVGKFAGWLTYFPALPNCVSMFHNSTGNSSTTSFMLQDHTLPVAWIWCAENVHCTQFGQLCILVSTWVPTCLVACSQNIPYHLPWRMVVVCLWSSKQSKWFSFNVFLMMAKTSLWASRLSIPESRFPKSHCVGSRSWCRGKFASLP